MEPANAPVAFTMTFALPTTTNFEPTSAKEVADRVREACASQTAIYPIGGGTSLDFGLVPRRAGIGIGLKGLNRVIDYPARDMTITVEAGITMQQLAGTLAAERQWLPVDAPQPEQATLGGVIACAASGPRRFGYGTMRDYVIGISAVDGRGMAFKGGGRVVKNVAGYDFCKLLTGSLGTLGIITQVTLKIRPLPQRSVLLCCDVPDLLSAERLLSALITSSVTPVAIEMVTGPAWNTTGKLIIGLEGTDAEVSWMIETLTAEWSALGIAERQLLEDEAAKSLWSQLREFPTNRDAPLVLKASLRPSGVCAFIATIRQIDPVASILAHAGNGIVVVRFAKFEASDLSRQLVGRLQPLARQNGGHILILSSNGLGELTRQAQWGGVEDEMIWMSKVKSQFDPQNVLNPGRFVFENL